MWRLFILCVFLVPASSFAQSTPPMPSGDSVTVLHPAPGIDYLYDQHGNSATVVKPMEGLHWYSAHDPQGRITAQGYLFDPIPAPQSLRVLESMRPPTQERTR